MKRKIRKLITGIMTASILSQFLSGTVSMAADIDGDSGSSDSAVVLEESVEGDEGEATNAESVDDAGVAGDNANASNDEDSSASDRATGASDNDEDSAKVDVNATSGQNNEEDLDVDTVSAKFSDDVTSGVEGSEDDLSSDGSVSSNDNFMTVSFGDAGVVDVLDDEDKSDEAKEEADSRDEEKTEKGVLESELSGEPYIFDYDSFRVEWNVVSHWGGACNVSVSLTNKSDETIHNWNLSFLSEDEIINPYNARITSEGSDGNKWTFKNLEYNQDIRSGESIQFGFQINYGERIDIPFSYSIDSSEKKVSDADYEISDQIISSWDGGDVGELHIVNNKDTAIEDWTVTVRTDAVFLTVWGGNIKKVSEDTYEFSCPDYCQNIAPGQTAVIGYQLSGDNTELNVLELREKASEGVLNDTISDNSISENSISENSISENSISENSVSDNSVSDNSLAKTFITLDTDAYGENAAGPIVTEKIDHISGTVLYPESISLITYKVMDVMDKCVKEGELDIEGSDWKAEGIGLSVGINDIVFTIIFNDKSEKEEIISITNTSIENMYAADIDLSDNDSDGMPNYFEEYFGTDLEKDDTDEDGLKDTEEMYLTGSDPLVYDSLKSGVSDGDYDTDEDGLSNRTEVGLGTDPLYADTDYDELNDGYEYNTTGTDPLKYDTDEDGFSDKEELDLGLDPFNADSDGNGIADGDELIAQTVSNEYPEGPVDKVTVNIACKGSVIENMYISDKFDGNSIVTDVEGIIGEPVIIECFSDFDTADITFTYDETMLGDTNEEDLCMMWYDEANNDFILLEDSVVDTVNNTVTYHTTHFSTYLILDKAKFKKAFENKKLTIDLTEEKEKRDYYVFVVDFTASEESVNEQLRAVKAIMEYIDSVEPYSDYKDYNYDMWQYTDSFPKYILVYGRSGGAGYTYGDIATGHYDLRFNLENFDEVIQYYRDKGIVGTNTYDADFGYAAYNAVVMSTDSCYFFAGDRYRLDETWKSKIDRELNGRVLNGGSLPVINTVTLNNYGYNCFDEYVSEDGKVYRAVNGNDAVIEDIIRNLKNRGVGKDLSEINHSAWANGKLKYENDAYFLFFDITVSIEELKSQITIAEAIIDQMEENDSVGINLYYNCSVESTYHLTKEQAIERFEEIYNYKLSNEMTPYSANLYTVLSNGTFADAARYAILEGTYNRNVKIFVFYPGNLYDNSIYEYLDKPIWSGKGINDSIKYAADNDVIVNSIAITYPTSQYMDSLIPITGGMSYSDQDGIDALIEQILNDLAAQKEAVKNIAAGDSDGDGLPDNEEIEGVLGANGHLYHSNPYEKDSDGDGFFDGEEIISITETKSFEELADFDCDGETTEDERNIWLEVICKTDADNNGIDDATDMINASAYTYYRVLSDPMDKESYCRMIGDNFIEVNEGYCPYDYNHEQSINHDIVTKNAPWGGVPLDRDGNQIEGLINLHDSLDELPLTTIPDNNIKYQTIPYLVYKERLWKEALKVYYVSRMGIEYSIDPYKINATIKSEEIGDLSGNMFGYYLCNIGGTYTFDAKQILFEPNGYFHYIHLMNRMKKQCEEKLLPGETCFIATSPYYSNYATRVIDDANERHDLEPVQLAEMSLSFDTLSALNSSYAGIYAECSYDGEEYKMEMDYYIWDWYDFSPDLLPSLYSLNTFDYAQSFEVIGKTHFSYSWK